MELSFKDFLSDSATQIGVTDALLVNLCQHFKKQNQDAPIKYLYQMLCILSMLLGK